MSDRFTLSVTRRMASAVALVFVITSVFVLAAPSSASAWSQGQFSASSESQLVALTNQSRAAAGLKALKVDSTLRSIARWRSKDMIDRDYFSHDIPGCGQVFDVMSDRGYCYHVAGENIGWNNASDASATADDPAHVHGLQRPPRQHPRQGLGRHRRRRLQGRERQEDVDGPLRRHVRLDQSEAQAGPDRQAEADAVHPDRRGPTPEADAEAHAQADGPEP